MVDIEVTDSFPSEERPCHCAVEPVYIMSTEFIIYLGAMTHFHISPVRGTINIHLEVKKNVVTHRQR